MMTQAEYLSRLEYLLQSLPEDKKWEMLDDIRQHFDEGIAAGIPEEEIAEGLGAPELLAQEYIGSAQDPAGGNATPAPDLSRRMPRKAARKPGVLGRIWRGIFLFFLDLCVALPVFITLYALWFALLVTGVSMSIAGIGSVLVVLVTRIIPLSFVYVGYPMFTFVACITVTAVGMLLAMAMRPVGRWVFGLTGRFLRWNGRVMTGGNAYEA